MKKWCFFLGFCAVLLACNNKKKQSHPEEPIKIGAFIDFFPETKTPVKMADSTAIEMESDTIPIEYQTFSRFVPDSLLSRVFGKNGRPLIYPIFRVTAKSKETYLFLKALSKTHQTLFVAVFDKDKKFVSGMPLLVKDDNSRSVQTVEMDNRYSITTNLQRKTPEGLSLYNKAVYAFANSTNSFILILTESNDQTGPSQLINPIDTLPAKNKLSGDYILNKKNIVSIRDSKKPNEILFFIHFENESGDCKGELKASAKLVGAGKAIYQQSGDQCVLQLLFAGNKVSLKEEEACGSHRDIKCFFEGSFIKKPPVKTKTRAKKK